MRLSLKEIFISLAITLLLLMALEVVSATFIPFLGFKSIKIPFNILIVLYLALRIDDNSLPYFIFSTQLVHSMFSNEGWAMGTLIGIIISFLVSVLKDVIQFSSMPITVLIVQVFQVIWFLLLGLFISIKMGSFQNYFDVFSSFFPESIMLSLISPFLFSLLNKIWRRSKAEVGSNVW